MNTQCTGYSFTHQQVFVVNLTSLIKEGVALENTIKKKKKQKTRSLKSEGKVKKDWRDEEGTLWLDEP